MKRLAPLFLFLLSQLGCQYAVWQPADAGEIPMPPHPDDSVEAREADPFADDAASGLIARKILFGNPEKASPRISADGKRIAFLAPKDGVMNVWVAPAEDLSAAEVITSDRKRGIRVYFWAYDNRHVVYLQDEGGNEDFHAFSVDVDSKKQVDLTPMDGVRAQIVSVSHKHPSTILIGINDRDPRYHDLYAVDVASGKRTLVQHNDGYGSFVVDLDHQVRLAVKPSDDGGDDYFIKRGDAFVPWLKIEMEDALTTTPRGFDASGKVLYLDDSRKHDTSAFGAVRLPGTRTEVVAHDPKADVEGVMFHPVTRAVQAVVVNHLRKKWRFFDQGVKADVALLEKEARGDIEIVSRTLDDRRWIVGFAPDDGPTRYVLFNRDDKQSRALFVNRPELENLALARMRPIEIKSRDGKTLVSYLTLPASVEGERPPSPLPMVLLVHGGPWGRDTWGYNPYHQWLADRGYAVLSVNYRGSTGFGKSFINASNMQWAGAMHDDLIDAVAWAVAEKIARPDKVAIMGGSYGGYATLVGLTFTPEQFACGVDIVGPSNLVTLLSSIPPYWAPYIALFKKRVGDHETDAGKAELMKRSPLSRAGAIVRPLLIGQGANDPRVKQAESDQIVAAMKERGIPVTYVVYPDEGHGFRRPENGTSFNAVAEAFLAACLGGKQQPFGRDLDGASLEVRHGAAHVPGLRQALGAKK